MRRIHVEKLKEDMLIAKPIFSSNGEILFDVGIKLTDRQIEKIMGTGLRHIYIEDEISKGIFNEEIISKETEIQIQKALENSIKGIKNELFRWDEIIIHQVEDIIKEMIENPRVKISIQDINNKNGFSFMHAMNVCVVSCFLGTKMNYKKEQLAEIAMGALFHDLGKVNLMMDCTLYVEDYSEEDFKIYKQHVEEGYEMIQEIAGLSLETAEVARFHHENYDGSGFPLGLKGDEIPAYTRIVSIANEYDNLLNNLPFGLHMEKHEIIKSIISKSNTYFDPEIVKIFMESISQNE